LKRSATWPWSRIGLISFILGVVGLVAVFWFDWQASFIAGGFIWFAAYSAGRQDQTEAFGIRMIEFIKKHHEGNGKEPWT
jgi:hypothetical protein